MITKEQMNQLATKWGIDQFTVLREYIQLVFLFHLYSLRGSEKLFFKGGTSLRLLFGSFRFSEDLDFTSRLSFERTRTLFGEALKLSKRELEDLFLEPFQRKRYSLITRLKYKPEDLTQPIGIHIEISMREGPLTKVVSPVETIFPISPYPAVTHLDIKEILAEKIRALTKRKKGRDVFDIWYILSKEVVIDWDMVNRKMKFYKENILPQDLIAKLEQMKDDDVKDDLNKFLPRHQRKIIPQLKERIIKRLRSG